jgi:hypothetical protein
LSESDLTRWAWDFQKFLILDRLIHCVNKPIAFKSRFTSSLNFWTCTFHWSCPFQRFPSCCA